MATNIKPLLSHENGTELCRVREEGAVKGFRKDILTENLTERECTFLTCSRCQGILREACNSNSGEQFCLCCKKKEEQTHPNLQVRNTVPFLESLCPIHQRGCNWVGNLGDCEKHLEVCGYVHEKCKLGCGVVLSRDELRIHSKEICAQRIVVCRYCRGNQKYCDLLTHLSRCNKMSVPCELMCDKQVIRENVAQHMDNECGEKEVNCPFVQYGCKVGLIKRKEMNLHLVDTIILHLGMKVNSSEKTVMKQKETISQLSEKIEALKGDIKQKETISQLSEKIEDLLEGGRYDKVHWHLERIRDILERGETQTSEEYILCGFRTTFTLIVSESSISIGFRILDRQRPFEPLYSRGHFIARIVCPNDREGALVFKSRQYVIGQRDSLLQMMLVHTSGEIVTFNRDRFVAKFIRDGGIDLEIALIVHNYN